MLSIPIVDVSLPRTLSDRNGHSFPTIFKWRHIDLTCKEDLPFVVYTDHCMMLPGKIGIKKIGWILEPEEYIPEVYEYVRNNFFDFDVIFTRDQELLALRENFNYYNPANSWISKEYCTLYAKDKNISMVASWKNFMSGHKIRHQILNRYMKSHGIHWYGKKGLQEEQNSQQPFDPNAQNPVNNLLDAYKDYRFTIIVENVIKNFEFTEKIVSPILCGTIPVYLGCPWVGQYLEPKGIITFDSVDELEYILPRLNEETYNKMTPYAIKNFEHCRDNYMSLQDNFYYVLRDKGILDGQIS